MTISAVWPRTRLTGFAVRSSNGRAICDRPGCVRGLSTGIRGFKARVAGHQHAYAQTKDCRCKDRRKDGRRAIEEDESDQGSEHGTSDRP